MQAAIQFVVSFLTPTPAEIRQVVGSLTAVVALPFSALALAGSPAPDSLTPDWHSTDAIKEAAEAFLREDVAGGDERYVPVAGHLDPRLRLAQCSEALDPYLQSGSKTSGRLIVGIRCRGTKPWNIYIPVHMAIMEDVLIAARPLSSGRALTAADLQLAKRDVSGLLSGYATDPSAVVGQRVKRSVAAGKVLTPSQLRPAILVERGQTVTLTVAGASLNIEMLGKALMDGAANQRIRVQNIGSGRVVEGLVRSAEHVQVIVK